MTCDKSPFTKLSKAPTSHVELGNGSKAEIVGCGTITIKIVVSLQIVPVVLENVFLVPQLGYQLISVSTFSKRVFLPYFRMENVS